MERPFTVVIEPPSQAELPAVRRMRRTWLAGVLVVLAIGALFVVSSVLVVLMRSTPCRRRPNVAGRRKRSAARGLSTPIASADRDVIMLGLERER